MSVKLPDFSRIRVLVAGDLMLDRYWQGAADRISPEAPVPVVRVEETEDRAGGAANVAVNIARLGGRVTVSGLLGPDEAGEVLRGLLGDHGIDCLPRRAAPVRTITKLRVVSRHQQLVRLDFEQPLDAVDTGPVEAACLERLGDADALVLSDYCKGTLRDPERLIAAARSSGLPVLVDPKGADFTRYRGATLLTPNLQEFEAVVGSCGDDRALILRGERLRDELALEGLLVTLGERGMLLLQRGQPALHLPTRAREVYDVTGAGDTVVAVLAAAVAAGASLVDAAGLANLAAGVVVGKLGTASVSPVELRGAVRQQGEWSAVHSEPDLLAAVEEARVAGERIVMTNGCFDILHEGHVKYLQQARRLGDRLVVAVNSDASVRRLKGEGRPVNDLAQRLAVLAGLASVDWLVAFDEETPERLICRVCPDVLVKGGDYRPEEIAGYGCVRAAGGEVRVLDFIPDRSTSRIVDTIRREAP